ncbi:MAG TPA: protein kinase, partial [Xanthobacteraceae bacterium]|nr:protein kinase [Xanthobacteraceae bacterium]
MAGGEHAPDPYAPHMYALPAGTLLHEFRIDALLGHGGFGITYRAFDTSLHKVVAIKEYLPNDLAARVSDSTVRAKSADEQQQFEQGVAAFLDEARLVARVRHRNIMEVLRFFKLNGTGYIVLGYEQGRTLKQRLDDGPLAEGELRHLLGGLLDGIEALHGEAILHRDLKPSNIILSDSRVPGERAVPVLIDFGAARDFRSRHSRSVTTIVAPGYAPPEQYGIGGQAGPWSDLYALGATAYRCVTGAAPPEALRRLRKDPYVPAVTAAAGRYDEGLLRLIDRMLLVEEAERPQSAAEVKAALRSQPVPAREVRPPGAGGAMAAARAVAPARSRRLAGILGGVVAAAVVALGAVLWVDGTIAKFLGKTGSETAVETTAAPAPGKPAVPAPTVAATPKTAAAPAQTGSAPAVKRSLIDAVAAGFEPVADLGHLEGVRTVAFAPDGRTLASAGWDDKT